MHVIRTEQVRAGEIRHVNHMISIVLGFREPTTEIFIQ
jgi:hypothetical protein